ncbi:MAG TPA: hypothetical protein VGP24_14540 [Glaciihabitans sp.]|nr:hypothetical protein [Glaciihabitans sp.]
MTAPSRKDRLRPLELLVLSGIIAVFMGVVVFVSTRELGLGFIFLGIAFIVSLMTLAMLALSAKPDAAEKSDLSEQDHLDDNRPDRPLGH